MEIPAGWETGGQYSVLSLGHCDQAFFYSPTPQTCFIVFEMQKAAYMDTVFGATFLKQEDFLLQK